MMGHKPPESIAKTINAIQRYIVTETRLGIPAIFPQPSAPRCQRTGVHSLSGFDRARGDVGSYQHSGDGGPDATPDAVGGSAPGTLALTRGMQPDDLLEGVIATAQHFLGYTMTEGGQNMAATLIVPRELYDVYARPFEETIRLSGLGFVMASSWLDGLPIHVSRAGALALAAGMDVELPARGSETRHGSGAT